MFRSVPVRGGELSVEVLPAGTEPVLAIHGVSSNCRLWNWFRAEAPEISLVAPDLRGWTRSITVAGPSSLAQHAEDMVAVLDELGLDRGTVCGMSMGGFVAVVMATTHPQRVRDVVLVDGGLPMARGGPDRGRRPGRIRRPGVALGADPSPTPRSTPASSCPGCRCSTGTTRCCGTTWPTTWPTAGCGWTPTSSSPTPSTPCWARPRGGSWSGRPGSSTRSGRAPARGAAGRSPGVSS